MQQPAHPHHEQPREQKQEPERPRPSPSPSPSPRASGRALYLVKPIILPRTTMTSFAPPSRVSSSEEDGLTIIRHTRSSVIVSEPKVPVWMYLLFFVWCLFSAWIVVDVIVGSTFHDNDLALAALMLLVASAIAGSRLFLWFRDYRQHRRNVPLFAASDISRR
jgi:hypothetical protein